jgi:hypothetical protein
MGTNQQPISKHLRPGPGGPQSGLPGQPNTNPYQNPYQEVVEHFFDPTTPNDPVFADVQAPYEISTASPIGQIMSDFQEAQSKLKNNGGK